jgi:hypothetical protein
VRDNRDTAIADTGAYTTSSANSNSNSNPDANPDSASRSNALCLANLWHGAACGDLYRKYSRRDHLW